MERNYFSLVPQFPFWQKSVADNYISKKKKKKEWDIKLNRLFPTSSLNILLFSLRKLVHVWLPFISLPVWSWLHFIKFRMVKNSRLWLNNFQICPGSIIYWAIQPWSRKVAASRLGFLLCPVSGWPLPVAVYYLLYHQSSILSLVRHLVVRSP